MQHDHGMERGTAMIDWTTKAIIFIPPCKFHTRWRSDHTEIIIRFTHKVEMHMENNHNQEDKINYSDDDISFLFAEFNSSRSKVMNEKAKQQNLKSLI